MNDDQLDIYLTKGMRAFEEKHLTEAEYMFTLAAREAERVEGESLRLANCLHNLAVVLNAKGNQSSAITQLRRSIAMLDASNVDCADELLAELIFFEQVCVHQQDYVAGEALTRRIIGILENESHKDHYKFYQWLNQLGLHLINLRRYSEADSTLNLALRLAEAKFDPGDKEIGRCLLSIAQLHAARGLTPFAIETYMRVIEAEESNTSPDKPFLANAINNLAGEYLAQNNFIEAELHFIRALAMLNADSASQSFKPSDQQWSGDSVGGLEHGRTEAIILNNLGVLAMRKQDLALAEHFFRRCVAHYNATTELSHPDRVQSLKNLVQLLHPQKRFDEAIEIYEELLEVFENSDELIGSELEDALFALIFLYDSVDRFDEGDVLLLRWARLSNTETVNDVINSLESMISLRFSKGRYRTARRMLKLREALLGTEHLDVLKSIQLLIETYKIEDEQPAELDILLPRAAELSEKLLGADMLLR